MKRRGRDIGDSPAKRIDLKQLEESDLDQFCNFWIGLRDRAGKEIDLKQPKEHDLDQFCNFWIGSGDRAAKIIDLNHHL